jgi:glycosyltransferase involved in cell wall biosynthesis
VISVVMPVRDAAATLAAAVDSLVEQTDPAWELVAVDDGSTDASGAMLQAYARRDRRIRVVRTARRGLVAALNAGLVVAAGPLVARLDADDVALPQRMARQRAFLAGHPEVGLLGTAAREEDPGGTPVRVVRPPVDDAALRRALIRANPFVHSSVMLRREVLARAGGYDEGLAVAQDYELWMRLARLTRLACTRLLDFGFMLDLGEHLLDDCDDLVELHRLAENHARTAALELGLDFRRREGCETGNA